jgi:hypothetical protein
MSNETTNAENSYLLPTKKMSVDQMITSRKEYIKEWYDNI